MNLEQSLHLHSLSVFLCKLGAPDQVHGEWIVHHSPFLQVSEGKTSYK